MPNEKKKKEARGTQNEFEIVKLIVQENRTLYLKVMDKIRLYKEMRGLSAFEELKKNQDAKIQKLRDRSKL